MTVSAVAIGILAVLPQLAVAQSGRSGDSYAVDERHNVMVPMRDGVRLSTDIYRPDAPGQFPVIMVRDPYSNGSTAGPIPFAAEGRRLASLGFVYLHQDVRGRFDSEGSWYAFANEFEDGYDAVEWAGTQPWSNGKVGMRFGSYLAYVQWQAASQGPKHLTALVPMFSPLSLYHDIYPGGAFELTRIVWSTVHSGRTPQGFNYDWERYLHHLPIMTLDSVFGHDPVPLWRSWVAHQDFDAYWRAYDMKAELPNLDLPVYNVGGWYDTFLRSTIAAYTGMTAKSKSSETRRSQRLVIGPWPHGATLRSKAGELDFGASAVIDIDSLELRWFDYWLRDRDNGVLDEPPINIFVMGENVWRAEHEWPLARTRYTKYYLHSGGNAESIDGDGRLSTTEPGNEPSDPFVYDPHDPVPTRGGNLPGASPNIQPGPFDQREIEARPDVLVYTTEPLATDVEVTGPLTVTLFAAATGRDTDFTAKLVDVYPDGRAYNLADGIVRARYRESLTNPTLIEPGKVYAYTIDLVATSNVFKRGHRIRIEISSSNFPRFSRNLNTGNPLGTDDKVVRATQTIYHDRQHPSHIVLPVIPR